MGSGGSKHRDSIESGESPSEDTDFVSSPPQTLQNLQKNVEKLRKEYRTNQNGFLLNQVLFSVQFFQNYDQELSELISNQTLSVKELSLTEDQFLTYLKPDEALSLVNRHVQFCAQHGPDKGKVKPLVSNRIFVIYENIQVVADANNLYANIDRPSLTAQVVEKHRKGYVRLKYIEDLKFKNSISSQSSSMTTSDDTCSETSDYGRITKARTIQPMPKIDPQHPKKTLYPVAQVRYRNVNLDDENSKPYYYVPFVDSKKMMEQFHRNWPDIAKPLELDDEDIETGYNCDSIFCRSQCGQTMWEIIPAVQLPKGAYEHFQQAKSAYIQQQILSQRHQVFPNEVMLSKIAHMDRLAIPRGFISKYRDEPNEFAHLEWELAHPKVEKFLQQQLTHTHIRTLLMFLLILKTFVEPKTTHQGVTIRHLVIHLFWELQKNVVIDETRMGTRLLKIIDEFCTKLGKGILSDYFVEERNHFENIPSTNLRHALNEFSRTRDKPLKCFMAAIRNLEYKDVTIPVLDVKELHKILTKKKMFGTPKKVEKNQQTKLDWEAAQRRKLRQSRNPTKPIENLKTQRKASVDSIVTSEDLPEELQPPTRDREILIFFLDHYMQMARSLNSLGNMKQAKKYLKQAEVLTYLFPRACQDDALKYQEEITKLRKSFEEEHEKRSLASELSLDQRRKSQSGSKLPDIPQRSTSVLMGQFRMVNKAQVDVSKVIQHHQNSEVRGKLLRRTNSKPVSESDSDSEFEVLTSKDTEIGKNITQNSRNRKVSEVTLRRRKTVNWNSEVMIAKEDTTDSVMVNESEVSSTSESENYEDYEEEDFDGMDEIISDDEETSSKPKSVIEVVNHVDKSKLVLDLGYNPDDTFT